MNRLLLIFLLALRCSGQSLDAVPVAGSAITAPALWLPLEGDLGDRSAQRHPVEAIGAIPLEGNGAYLGGRRNWIEAPHIPLNGRPFAVAFWLQETTNERTVELVEQFDRNARRTHLHLMLRGNRQPYFGFLGSDLASPVGIPRDGSWVHLVFQFTGTHQQIWINGHLICTRESPPYDGEMGVTSIGKAPRWSNVPSTDLVGRLRDFRVYQRSLSPTEVAHLSTPAFVSREQPSNATTAAPALVRKALPKSPPQNGLAQMMPSDIALPFLQIEPNRLTINGRAGQVYSLLHSPSFSDWKPLLRLTNSTGTLILTSASLPQMASGFFFVEVVAEVVPSPTP